LNSPYRIRPLKEQKYYVPELSKAKKIRFDYETASFIKNAIEIFNNKIQFSSERMIINLYNFPELTYLLGGTSPGYPWYANPKYKNNDFINCHYINFSNKEKFRTAIILQESSYPITQDFIACLMRHDVLFPDDYMLIDSLAKPKDIGYIYIYMFPNIW